MSSSSRTFILASRESELAQKQTNIVVAALRKAHPEHKFETSFMTTGGDHNQSQALYLIGGKALWTKELEVALKEKVVDFLVHSLKDVPTVLPGGYELAGITEREDPVDSLVVRKGLPYKTLEEFPAGSVVGTSSVRRVAQLKRNYPNLKFLDVRGNINTRLRKLDDENSPFTGIILAKAGMVRINLDHRITLDLSPPSLFHAVSQGALGIEIRSDDEEARNLLQTLIHKPTQYRCEAERAMLRVLEGGCSVPVGASSEFDGTTLTLTGCVTALDGSEHVQHTLSAPVHDVKEAITLGEKLAVYLSENGAKAILDSIIIDRERKIKAAEIQDIATETTAVGPA